MLLCASFLFPEAQVLFLPPRTHSAQVEAVESAWENLLSWGYFQPPCVNLSAWDGSDKQTNFGGFPKSDGLNAFR